MTELMNIKKARILAVLITFSFLIIHICLLLLFRHYGVEPMARFNMFSIPFYVATLFVVNKKMFRFFVLTVYLEVVAHMSAAVYFTGWESGFQNTLIGINIILFYTEYVGRYLKHPYFKATPISLIGMIAYLVSCVVSHYHTAPYPLPSDVTFMLQFMWGVIVFVITIFFLYTFVKLTAGSDELLSREVGHDKLTGMPNRYYMSDYLDRLSAEPGLEGHWIAMVDIDDFKNINDTYGHNCGDYILKELGSILQGSRASMAACRWGGEEFLMLGRVEHSMEFCYGELELLRRQISRYPFQYEGSSLKVTVTIGVAAYRPGIEITEWIDAADEKLYNGKTNGKNQVMS